jgi:hypothetical protein
MPKDKRSKRKRSTFWPKLEESIFNHVKNLRNSGFKVSTIQIRLKANQMAREQLQLPKEQDKDIANFKGSISWCSRFMKRYNLTKRQVTTVGQKLLDDWKIKVEEFKIFSNKKLKNVKLYIKNFNCDSDDDFDGFK